MVWRGRWWRVMWGFACAGDKHFIANTSDKPVTYFVVTVGPPE